MRELQLSSPAKVNLLLRIVGKRDDGYHDIETVLQTIELSDQVRLRRAGHEIALTCDDPPLPPDRTNLAHRAASILLAHANTHCGIHIHLQKRIPVGAGLGGGSSNAATVLVGLTHLLDLSIPRSELIELAGTIGSDVPFFIEGGTTWATGRGDILHPLPSPPPLWLVIVYPGYPISSGWAYRMVRKVSEKLPLLYREVRDAFEGGDVTEIGTLLMNDFEPVVYEHYPALAALKGDLTGQGAVAACLSGSGSSLFALVEDEVTAHRLAEKMVVRGLWAYATRTIGRREV
jgi:4-diphosphocytidyl-2-C-methyl-D-erythritol kinase